MFTQVIKDLQCHRVTNGGPPEKQFPVDALVAEKLAAGESFDVFVAVVNVSELSSPAKPAGIEMVVDDDPGSQTGPDGEPDKIGIGFSLTVIFFSQGEAVGVVVHLHRFVEIFRNQLFQGYGIPTGNVDHIKYGLFFKVYQPGNPDADPIDSGVKHLFNGLYDSLDNFILRPVKRSCQG